MKYEATVSTDRTHVFRKPASLILREAPTATTARRPIAFESGRIILVARVIRPGHRGGPSLRPFAGVRAPNKIAADDKTDDSQRSINR